MRSLRIRSGDRRIRDDCARQQDVLHARLLHVAAHIHEPSFTNKGLELTARSVRSCLAPASGRSSGLALGALASRRYNHFVDYDDAVTEVLDKAAHVRLSGHRHDVVTMARREFTTHGCCDSKFIDPIQETLRECIQRWSVIQ